MSKEIKSNLIVHKSLAVTALGQFIQCLLSESLKEMGKNIDEKINNYVATLQEKENDWKVDLSKVDFSGLAKEVKKEIVKTFEAMSVEFKDPSTNENKR